MNKLIYLLAIIVGLVLGWFLLSQSVPKKEVKKEIYKTVIDSMQFQGHWVKIIKVERSWDLKQVQEVNVYNGQRLTNRILIGKGKYLGMQVGYYNYQDDKQDLYIWTSKEEIILMNKGIEQSAYENVEQLQLLESIQSPYKAISIGRFTYLTTFYKTSDKKEEENWTCLVWQEKNNSVEVLGRIKTYGEKIYYYPKNAAQGNENIVIPYDGGQSQESAIEAFWQAQKK